jgi:hypothetical protein
MRFAGLFIGEAAENRPLQFADPHVRDQKGQHGVEAT